MLVVGSGSVSVAGCVGLGDDEERRDDAPGDPTDSPTPSAEVADALEAAGEHLGTAADLYGSEVEKVRRGVEEIEFRTREIRTRLDRTVAELEDARAEATSERRAAIDTVLSIVEWLRGATNALESYGESLVNVERGVTYYTNGRYQDAADGFERARTDLEGSTASLDRAATVYDRLDLSTLEAIDIDPDDARSDLAAVEARARELGTYVEAMEYFADGLRLVSVGRNRYETGERAAEEERFAEAIEPLERAGDDFERADEIAHDGEDASPNELLEAFLALTCTTGHLREAAEEMHTAATEAEAGNTEAAEEPYERAIAAEEAADAC